ncbi:MAG: hypothetical protein K8W52_37460 [Deltaproteobacteria bacterium]|nr:hypothetical protein [Deltaproteobacteria bacterium]
MTSRATTRAGGLLLILVAACGTSNSEPPTVAIRDAGGSTVFDARSSDAIADLGVPLPRTERADAAMGSIAARILDYARTAQTQPSFLEMIVPMYLVHAQVTGRVDDYVGADLASEAWVAQGPSTPDPHRLRARVLTTLHRFDKAAAELDTAVKLGASPAEVADQRTALAAARGVSPEAFARAERVARDAPGMVSIADYAIALAERDQLDRALALMPTGLRDVRDPSVIPVAWFLFQWARLAEDHGDRVKARALYAETYRRLPRYGEAGRHLAAMMIEADDLDGARAILTSLAAADPHPETTAMLADCAIRAHDPNAQALVAEASAGWERYLARYPAAFSDHAARFYLGVGADPERAYALATANRANRATAEAMALLVEAALATHRNAEACAAADQIVAIGPAPRRFRFAAWKAYQACGRSDDATALGRALGI